MNKERRCVLVAVLLAVALVFGAAAAGAAPLGAVTEYACSFAGCSPGGIAAGPDGKLWFISSSATPRTVGLIDPTTGAMSSFPVPATSVPRFRIVAGPDGNMWFTDQGTPPALARITTGGTLTEFSSGLNPGSLPTRLNVGPDGNLWFTDQGTTPAIGRITPGGTITEFSLTDSLPAAVVTGPDGNLWFTDQGSTPAIGRITPGGAITEYSTGLNPGSSPRIIAAGPDGNLWFSDQGTTKAIGRITPGGVITEFTSGLDGAIPSTVEPMPDGNIWFSDQATAGTAGGIGRITADGTITVFRPGFNVGSRPMGIIPGPDGNLWFADAGPTKAIGRFGLGDWTPPVVTVPADVTVEATGPLTTVTYGAATATDPDDAAGPVTCSPASGSGLAVGTTQVTCRSTDTNGNIGSATFHVVVRDTTAPVLMVPGTVVVNATSPGGAAVTFTATASDLVDGAETVICDPSSGSAFAIGTTTVHCTASDAAGNSGGASFRVTVEGAVAQLQHLSDLIDGFNLKKDKEEKFEHVLADVRKDLGRGRTLEHVCADLDHFVEKAAHESGKSLTAGESSQLVTAAMRIEAVVDC